MRDWRGTLSFPFPFPDTHPLRVPTSWHLDLGARSRGDQGSDLDFRLRPLWGRGSSPQTHQAPANHSYRPSPKSGGVAADALLADFFFAVFRRAVRFLAAFLRVAFFAVLRPAFLRVAFLRVAFLRVAFLRVAFLRPAFLRVAFLRVAFFGAAFLAVFLRVTFFLVARFFVALRLAVAIGPFTPLLWSFDVPFGEGPFPPPLPKSTAPPVRGSNSDRTASGGIALPPVAGTGPESRRNRRRS